MTRRRQRDPVDEYVVRLFSDHAETPVWYPSSTNWEDLGLTGELERDLFVLNDRRRDIEDPADPYAVVPSERGPYEAEGLRLARELALDLGVPWVV